MNDITTLLEVQENRVFFERADYDKNRRLYQNCFKIEKKVKKMESRCLVALVWSLDYLDPERDFRSLVYVCRQWHRSLTPKLVKRYLMNRRVALAPPRRKLLWFHRFGMHQSARDYAQIEAEYLERGRNNPKQQQIEDLIRLDVLRSFQNSKSVITQEDLFEMLKLYAFHNPEVAYCQGMNFLLGFLFIFFQSRDEALRFFIALVDALLYKILQNDLTYIKVLFYKLDRIIQIQLPDVSDHFQSVKLESGHYAAAWFLTIFTNGCFQDQGYGEVIFEVWDIILQEGWKGMFKIILSILRQYRPMLLNLKFDNLLSFLNNLSKTHFYRNTQLVEELRAREPLLPYAQLIKIKPILNFKLAIQDIHLPNELLHTIEKEFTVLKQKISTTLNKLDSEPRQ